MAGENRQLSQLDEVLGLQHLKRERSAAELAGRELERIAAEDGLRRSQAEALALSEQLRELLDGRAFDCAAYSLLLAFFEAQSAVVNQHSIKLEAAIARSRSAAAESHKADAQYKLLQSKIRTLGRKLARKAEVEREAHFLDRYNVIAGMVRK